MGLFLLGFRINVGMERIVIDIFSWIRCVFGSRKQREFVREDGLYDGTVRDCQSNKSELNAWRFGIITNQNNLN